MLPTTPLTNSLADEIASHRFKSDTAADGVINTTDDLRRLSAFFLLAAMDRFTHDQIKPADPKAELLANAIIALIEAEKALQEAKSRVPRYTGQWDSRDYYAEEQEAWNRAVDALLSANAKSAGTDASEKTL